MKEELQKRVNLLTKAKSNIQLQEVENELCKRDILYRFKNYVFTDKNSKLYWPEMPSVLPFIPYEFQEECITKVRESIIKGESVFIEKSRQMGISWLIMAIFVYWRNFYNHKYLVLSQKQDDVDKLGDMKSLFEKARFMINNLPNWMLPKGFNKVEDMSYMRITRSDWTWSITWESANPNASRWGTYDAILPDEFAFQSNATTINTAMRSATSCIIYTSTPNGKGNEHYRMRLKSLPSKDEYGNIIPPSILGLRYHRKDHPLYTEARYKKKTASMDAVTIAQELEIDYDTAVVGRVYTEFPKESTNILYDYNKPLYISIDNSHGGTDPNAVLVIQIDWVYRNIIDSVEFNSTPEDSANYLWCTPKMQLTDIMMKFMDRFKQYNYKKAIWISDPYDTKSALGNSTILDDYRKVGIYLNQPQERSKQEQILKTRTNVYRIRYNDNCLDFASAILNARYPERKEDSNSTKTFTLPVHNWTSHYRTALEYFVTYFLENPLAKKNRILEDTRPKRNYMTWALVYPQKNRAVRKDPMTWQLVKNHIL